MMVTPPPHHHQQQPPQVRVVAEDKTMTPVSNSNNNENEDQAAAALAHSFSNDTNDSENSSSQVTTSSSSWRASQRASLKRLEATQKLNLILPQQQPQQVQLQNVNNQNPGANYLLTTQQHHQHQQQQNNKLSNCLSTPVIITSDGHHLGHHPHPHHHPHHQQHHLYLSPTAGHKQQQSTIYNSQQQQQQANQQLLFDSLAHQLNQQNGEVSLFTGLPSCTPASADRLAASAINPFFWNASTSEPIQASQQGGGADEQMRLQQQQQQQQQQNQWVSEQQNKMHATQNVTNNLAHHNQHHQKLTIADFQAASALSPIILSPLSFLGLSPEQESWLRYGYVSPQQHPLANRTYTDYNQQQQQNHHHHHHNQLNFSMQQAQQQEQAAKDLTQMAAANQRQQQQQLQLQQQARTSTTTTGHLNHSYNTQQLGAGLGKSATYFQQPQQQLEQNHFHIVTSDSQQQQQQHQQHHLPPQISPAPIAAQQQFSQHAPPASEARATPAQISSINHRNSATPAGKSIINDGYPTTVVTHNVGKHQEPMSTGQPSRSISREFVGQPPTVAVQAADSNGGRNSIGPHLLTAHGAPPSARSSPANLPPAGQSSSSRKSSTTGSSTSATNSTLSSRTTSRLSSYDVSPAQSDMELSNAAGGDRRQPLTRADSLSCSTIDGSEPRRLGVAATSLVNDRNATKTPAAVVKNSSNGTGAKQVGKKKSKVLTAPEPATVSINGIDENAPVKKKSRGGRKKKQVTHEELMARKNRSKERNRVAARRCRQKRKQFLDELRDRIDQLNATNIKLQRENLMLRNELSSLRQTHSACSSENNPQQPPQQQSV